MTTRTYNVEMTFAEILALGEVLRTAYSDKAYYATKDVSEEEDDSWQRREQANAIKARAELAKLYQVVTGDLIDAE